MADTAPQKVPGGPSRKKSWTSGGRHSTHAPGGDDAQVPTLTDRSRVRRGFLGTVGELEDLAEIIERKIAQTPPGGTFSIDGDYGTDNTVTTKFFVMEASFDPVSMDELVVSGRQAIVNESRHGIQLMD